MSAPGDVGRRLEWVEGPAEEVLAKAAQLVGEAGGKSFEFGYDAVDRDLGEDEEPDPGEPVRWFVKAVWRYKPGRGRRPVDRTVIRYGVAEPGGATHAEAITYATVALLEAMGANVALMFGGPE